MTEATSTPSAPATRRVPLPVAVVVILAALTIVGWQSLRFFETRPATVLHAFLRASEAGEYATMYFLLHSRTHERLQAQSTDLSHPETFLTDLFTEGKRVPDEARVRHEVLRSQVRGDSFIARVRTTVKTTPPIEPFEHDLIVRREPETTTWRVLLAVAQGRVGLLRAQSTSRGE